MRCPRCDGQFKGRPGLCPRCRRWLDENHPIAMPERTAEPWALKMAERNIRSAHVLLDHLIGIQLGHLAADSECPPYCMDNQVIAEIERRGETDLRMLLFAAIRWQADEIHRNNVGEA